MICPNPKCHQVLPDKAIICPYCGTRLNQKKHVPRKKLQTAAPPQPPARPLPLPPSPPQKNLPPTLLQQRPLPTPK